MNLDACDRYLCLVGTLCQVKANTECRVSRFYFKVMSITHLRDTIQKLDMKFLPVMQNGHIFINGSLRIKINKLCNNIM